MPEAAQETRRHELRQRLAQLEGELARIYGELSRLGPGTPLPGLYLLIEAGGLRAALPSSQVLEIVRLVETTPMPKAPPHVLGTFLYRGEPVLALDLSRYLGGEAHAPDIDAHMVVLASSRAAALVVDRVRSLVEAPRMAQTPLEGSGWLGSPLVAAFCQAEGELLPVLTLEPLLSGVPA
jgi:purine-binding chemotaxis protein CheW